MERRSGGEERVTACGYFMHVSLSLDVLLHVHTYHHHHSDTAHCLNGVAFLPRITWSRDSAETRRDASLFSSLLLSVCVCAHILTH